MSTNTKLAEALRLAREWFRHEEAGEGPQAYDVIKAADEAIAAHDSEQAQEAQQAAGQEQDERAAFEAWAVTYSTFPLERDDYPRLGTTGYTQMEQTMLWDAWQAAMNHAREASAWSAPVLEAASDAQLLSTSGAYADGWNECRAAILRELEEK